MVSEGLMLFADCGPWMTHRCYVPSFNMIKIKIYRSHPKLQTLGKKLNSPIPLKKTKQTKKKFMNSSI